MGVETFFGQSMERFQLKWIPCAFRSLSLLASPNLRFLPISLIFSRASCSPGSCRQCSIAEIRPKAWQWVNCSGAQMPPHYPGWKQPWSGCDGELHWDRRCLGTVPTSQWNPQGQQQSACPKQDPPSNPCEFFYVLDFVLSSSISSSSNSSDEESLSEEELAMLKEQVEQKKKLISTMRNKPWRMVKKLSVLRYPSIWELPLLASLLTVVRYTLSFFENTYLLLLWYHNIRKSDQQNLASQSEFKWSELKCAIWFSASVTKEQTKCKSVQLIPMARTFYPRI